MTEICSDEIKGIEINIGDTIYENTLGELTLSITDACNMNCVHCREKILKKNKELSISDVTTIMKFIRKYTPTYKDLTISGGEPLLHSDFISILRTIKKYGGEDVSMTTNGLLLTNEIINQIKKINYNKIEISISLDSLDEEEHNQFRQNNMAYKGVLKALDLLKNEKNEKFKIGLRVVLTPEKAIYSVMEKFVLFALQYNLDKITFSSVIPSGKALSNPHLFMNKHQKEEYIKNIYLLQKKYQKKNQFLIRTNDPLKFYFRGYSDVSTSEGELVFDGCGAGVVALNFKYDGFVYPCALLDYKLFYFKDRSLEEIEELYKNHDFIKNMILMKLKGKCGKCNYKFQCGGCRARALYYCNDIMGEDPECFL